MQERSDQQRAHAQQLQSRVEAEALGFMLDAARNRAEDRVFALVDAAGVTAAAFANDLHSHIFAAMEHLYTQGEVLTATRVVELIPEAQQANGLAALDDLAAASVVNQETFEHHLAALADFGHRRELAAATREATADLDAGKPPEEVEDRLRAAIDRRASTGRRVRSQSERWEIFSAREQSGPRPISIDGALRLRQPPLGADPAHAEHPMALAWRQEGKPSLSTLLNGGLHPGEVLAIAGSAGVGKSTLALQLADAVAARNLPGVAAGGSFIPVVYVGLELDGFDVLEMSLARLACVDVGRIHGGAASCSLEEQQRIAAARRRYQETIGPYLRVLDRDFAGYRDVTLDSVQRQVRRAKADFVTETALVIIDPLQRLVTGRHHADRDAASRAAALAQGVHALAKCEHVAVVALLDTAGTGLVGHEGRGPVRELDLHGSQVMNHLASTTLHLDTGGEVRELFPDLWKRDRYMKFMYAGEGQHADEFTYEQRQLAGRLERHKEFPLAGADYDYRRDYQSEYAVLRCAKRRWEESFSLVLHYHKAIKCFEELPV